MANLKRKLELLCDVALANIYKVRVIYDLQIRHNISVSQTIEPSLMVSLTTYGHRLRHSVEYTLYSLLKQELRPAKIIVWCDKDELKPELLPKSYQLLQQFGVEFKEYAPNIRSYKKLIPTLIHYPDYHHIIVDDDLYYSPKLIKELFATHQQEPEAIVAHAVTTPLFDESGKKLLPYKQWPQFIGLKKPFEYNEMMLVPLGYGGIFYPKDVFDKEVENEEVFRKLCPQADDLWFYVQGLRLRRKKVKLTAKKDYFLPVDLIRQILKKDRLHDSNFGEGQNNVQLNNLLEHYHLKLEQS